MPNTCGIPCPGLAHRLHRHAYEDADSKATVGGYFSIYDIGDAKNDKAPVPIYYESRLAKLDINRKEIDHGPQNLRAVSSKVAERDGLTSGPLQFVASPTLDGR